MDLLGKKQLIRDYQIVFGSPEGKRVLADLKKRAPLLNSSFPTGGGVAKVDTHAWAIEEGKRAMMLYIYKVLQLDPNVEQPTHAVGE